jgi:hypothetical protein
MEARRARDPDGRPFATLDRREQVAHRARPTPPTAAGAFTSTTSRSLAGFDRQPRAPELRAAFLAEHAARGTLPAGAEDRLAALTLVRRIQQLARLVEAREQPALRERWRDDARALLDRIAEALQTVD